MTLLQVFNEFFKRNLVLSIKRFDDDVSIQITINGGDSFQHIIAVRCLSDDEFKVYLIKELERIKEVFAK